jgi:hypothetical protein
VIQAWKIAEAPGDRSVIETDPEWRKAEFFETSSRVAAKLIASSFAGGKLNLPARPLGLLFPANLVPWT